VFLRSFAVGPWQANTYLVGVEGTGECVVVDPGVLAFDPVKQIVESESLTVRGVLLTHGHIDHVACAADVADHYGVPAWLHHSDRELLSDPGPGLRSALTAAGLRIDLREPADLRLLYGGETIAAAGLEFFVAHAPGHRPGCVMFRVGPGEPGEIVFTGDVVFAGSIGRTDLPGGDPDVMIESLRDVVLQLPDSAALLPGHGERTTMARERSTNPFLQASFLRNI
jgi:glyoxylase-like metal-dependent hydrolase (beta-lactamase superfamily II)